MSIIAVYNLKGGVGKTTGAVNLSFLAAASGLRTLLWDLDPQGASSFAFRIHARVAGFGRKSLDTSRTLAAAIKESDFQRLEVLPADFAYRKLDRLLSDRKADRAIADLLRAFGRDYDAIFLDCPPGFSLLTEAVFAASDLVLVPTIPTVLSLRTLARLFKWANRNDGAPALIAFLSMVDRRKALHRQTCQWAALHPEVFLAGQIPYASIVEQMAVRRMPLPVFAGDDPAACAFQTLAEQILMRLRSAPLSPSESGSPVIPAHEAINALIGELESASDPAEEDREGASSRTSTITPVPNGVQFVHGFDTDRGDLQRCGCALELHERARGFQIVASRTAAALPPDKVAAVQVQVDSRWAMQILAGALSPLTALERRLGQPTSALMAKIHDAVGDRPLRRVSSMTAEHREEAVVAARNMNAPRARITSAPAIGHRV